MSCVKIDLTGQKFNRLKVIEDSSIKKAGQILWRCECDCGKEKLIRAYDLKSGKQKSCGCLNAEKTAERNKKNSGNKSPCWKGGIRKSNGYIYIYAPNHHRANAWGSGYVKRCVLVAEKHFGKIIKSDEIIHHINGNRDDDRIENLAIMTRGQHTSLHHKNRIQIRDKSGRFIKGVVQHASQ